MSKPAGILFVCVGLVACLLVDTAAAAGPADGAVPADAVVAAKLTEQGKAKYAIALPPDASVAERYAGTELSYYIRAMSGADVETVAPDAVRAHRIRFTNGAALDKKLDPDGYVLAIRENDVIIAADTDRARLFAVYDLLERLGCRWLAPRFAFYDGQGEYVPRKADLTLELKHGGIEVAEPQFKIRKLDVEEGLSHNTENLKQLVEWAPKLRYNTIMVPRDYGGRGRVTWDQWRDAITPEAKKRGLVIEVGGHGYENFLNAKMEEGKLFEQHPEWFGQDEQGKRSKSQRRVFCTSNKDAVEFVTRGVLDYLASRPEIEVFEMWPPDGAEWCTCETCKALGEPPDRQALLVNHVQDVLAKRRPGVRLEIIAYSKALLPPQKVKLDPRILVDFCPINQSFEVPINDPSSERNVGYANALLVWREKFEGQLGLYSYYRKYAWKSLPALIPHYMKADLLWYRPRGVRAVMIYAEPGDWGTYEVNHYALGKLGWDADADVDAMLREFCRARYGDEHADKLAPALVMLGDTVRKFGSLPFTRMKSPDEIKSAQEKLQTLAGELPKTSPAFARLHLALDYATRDLAIQQLRAAKAPKEQVRKEVESLVAFLTQHKDAGVFILTGRNDMDRFLKRYGLEAKTKIEPGD